MPPPPRPKTAGSSTGSSKGSSTGPPAAAPPPPKDPIRQVVDLSGLDFQSPPPRRKKRKKTVPLVYKISFGMFIVGMILGAFMTLLLPYGDHKIAVADYKFTLPLSVHKYPMWLRWTLYVSLVSVSGYFWSRLTVRVCEKHFPQTCHVPRAEEEVSSLGSKIWRLDTPSED